MVHTYENLHSVCTLKNGKIHCEGHYLNGGDCSKVSKELYSIKTVYWNDCSFCALREDGRVFIWGEGELSLFIRNTQSHKLINVEKIYSNRYAFAVIHTDETVSSYGSPEWGGDSSNITHELHNIKEIISTDYAFCAIREDGNVFCWGYSTYGGNTNYPYDITPELHNITKVYGN